MPPLRVLFLVCLAVGASIGLVARPADASGKVQAYVIRMEPYGQDAERFSRHSWGGGLNVVVPAPFVNRLISGVAGVDYVQMLDQTTTTRDVVTGLRIEQQTSQDYGRIYLGAEIGPHGPGFLRPHAGVNIGPSIYSTSTDLVVPDDVDRTNEIRQNLHGETKSAFGYDLTFGCDFNFGDKVSLDVGARYLRSFGLPQQLGAGSIRIEPAYLAYYLGFGVSLDVFKKAWPKE